MTPKEKAQELWWKYFHAQSTEENENLDGEIAYQCALIAVDEILNLKHIVTLRRNMHEMELEYWEEVKQEIEKL